MTRREAWDPVTETAYIPRGVRRSRRPRLVRHTHRCPDGTWVVVSAQYILMTDTTLYRWTVGGVRVDVTSARGDQRGTAPDWSGVDRGHTAVA